MIDEWNKEIQRRLKVIEVIYDPNKSLLENAVIMQLVETLRDKIIELSDSGFQDFVKSKCAQNFNLV